MRSAMLMAAERCVRLRILSFTFCRLAGASRMRLSTWVKVNPRNLRTHGRATALLAKVLIGLPYRRNNFPMDRIATVRPIDACILLSEVKHKIVSSTYGRSQCAFSLMLSNCMCNSEKIDGVKRLRWRRHRFSIGPRTQSDLKRHTAPAVINNGATWPNWQGHRH